MYTPSVRQYVPVGTTSAASYDLVTHSNKSYNSAEEVSSGCPNCQVEHER